MRTIFKLLFIFHFPLFGIGTQFLILPFSTQELSLGSHPTISESILEATADSVDEAIHI